MEAVSTKEALQVWYPVLGLTDHEGEATLEPVCEARCANLKSKAFQTQRPQASNDGYSGITDLDRNPTSVPFRNQKEREGEQ